jgi:hypothetical protein
MYLPIVLYGVRKEPLVLESIKKARVVYYVKGTFNLKLEEGRNSPIALYCIYSVNYYLNYKVY